MWGLYKTQPAWVLGFHGCDEEIGRAVIAGDHHLEPSTNEYDWLGSGVYFWEGSPQRAEEWAHGVHKRRPQVVRKPFVVGAIIDLGSCFNLTDRSAAEELKAAFGAFKLLHEAQGLTMPVNKGGTRETLKRYRDRAVIEFMHELRKPDAAAGLPGRPSYDTVRSPFLEGDDLYEGAGIRSLTHIQIALRNLACIKGYFLPIRQT